MARGSFSTAAASGPKLPPWVGTSTIRAEAGAPSEETRSATIAWKVSSEIERVPGNARWWLEQPTRTVGRHEGVEAVGEPAREVSPISASVASGM